MTDQHTPGPWDVFTPTDLDDVGNIEDVYEVCEGSLVATTEQRAARARIIAAAPELLDALQHLADTIPDHAPAYAIGPNAAAAHKRARAAIAKAKGV